jgi:hypothetical protein
MSKGSGVRLSIGSPFGLAELGGDGDGELSMSAKEGLKVLVGAIEVTTSDGKRQKLDAGAVITLEGLVIPAQQVVQLEPTRAMVLKADGEDAPSWVWVLEPLDGGRTRLVERFRQGGKVTLASRLLGVYVLDSGGWVFSSKHLRGVKERAERQ